MDELAAIAFMFLFDILSPEIGAPDFRKFPALRVISRKRAHRFSV
jgi:hypothetical protein